MDFERINLLLDVFHKSLNVPNTDRIRNEVMAELTQFNTVFVEEPVVAEQEPELKVEGRRL